MKISNIARSRVPAGQQGMALVTVLLVTMLCSALMVGFITVVASDQRATGLDRDQTQAYAVAHAGLEKMTSDLTQLFKSDFSPNASQISGIASTSKQPVISGFQYTAPEGGSGYTVTYLPDASNNPRPENTAGSMITAGPYQGFMGIITPYWLTVTSRSAGGAEVRLRRQLQTVAIPVFQFGMFSETDLAFHAGDDFKFGGRVHTNGNLYLAQADNSKLVLSDRVTAVGHVIRTHLPNDLPTTTGYNGTVLVPKIIKQPFNETNDTRALLRTEGSLTGSTGKPSDGPTTAFWKNLYSDWISLSTGTYKSNLRNGGASVTDNPPFSVAGPKGTGARRLDLPLVADANGDGLPDAQPIELIRRPPPGDPKFIRDQRYYSMASMRILLSDTAAEITGLPGLTATAPVSLDPFDASNAGAGNYLNGITTPMPAANTWAPLATAGPPTAGMPAGNGLVTDVIPSTTYRANADQPLLGGFIKIEIQRNDQTWMDVTKEILSMGIAGRNLATVSTHTNGATVANTTAGFTNRRNALQARLNTAPAAGNPVCQDPSPNAIIRLQHVRDVPLLADGFTSEANAELINNVAASCGYTVNAANVIQTISQTRTDYWPNVLYDTREGQVRDGAGSTDIAFGGLVHYVEFDMNNLRRWLLGQIGSNGTQTRNDNGFIVYFSDRRGNKNALGNETAELGFEDTVNLATAAGTPNGVWPGENATGLDAGEDLNQDGRLQLYGSRPWPLSVPVGTSAACGVGFLSRGYAPLDCSARLAPGGAANGALTNANAGSATLKLLMARANKALFFRRALKIVNGGIQTAVTPNTCAVNAAAVPCNNVIAPGLTVASENPVYVQGNFNATAAGANVEPNVATSVIADAVTMLSNSWSDMRSFSSSGASDPREATTTSYRIAVVTGKTRFFPKPNFADASFGSDGGAHNFPRLLEDWRASIVRYRGSFVSFFYSRQGTGSFKCCDGDAYLRGDRDWAFDDDFLLPSLLPPGTPMFRDVNTLTFRQLLRPTQGQTGTDNQ